MIKQTADGVATVSTTVHWIPVGQSDPGRGQKVLVINRPDGVARIDQFSPTARVTHWAPLPTFRSEP